MKRRALGKTKLAVGDVVLMGMPGITPPSQWHVGEVLWFDDEWVLVSQSHIGGAGKPYPHLHEISYVRAVGTIEELGVIRRNAGAALGELHRSVDEALAAARAAVWQRLDEFAASEPLRHAGDGI
jgi:hypothetical protein